MKKVVRSISLRRKEGKLLVIGYASSNRGTRIVAGTREIVVAEMNKNEEGVAVKNAIAELLAPQLDLG